MQDFSGLWYDCESLDTRTSREQLSCEAICSEHLVPISRYSKEAISQFKIGGLVNDDEEIRILRTKHSIYLIEGLGNLKASYVSLDASRPWIIYWILHALDLLEREPRYLYPRIIETISHFWTRIENGGGGFGGGPQQIPHGAPNYATVLALCTIGTEDALRIINRGAMYRWFMSLKDASGGFQVHKDGEIDSRGTYTIISIARLLNILTPELAAGTAEFYLSCQTYEGGFGGEPFNEAHGGYNFCSLAALLILGRLQDCNLDAQENWLLHRQMKLEGGFQGRTNKLVDSCYSFWQGAAFAIVNIARAGGDDLHDMHAYFENIEREKALGMETAGGNGGGGESEEMHEADVWETTESYVPVTDESGPLAFNQKALQRYILFCGQQMDGGLRDKPGKARDHYHSCYALSGLSVAQHSTVPSSDPTSRETDMRPQVFGDSDNLLLPTSVVYNICLEKLKFTIDYFHSPQMVNTHEGLMNE